MDEWNRPTAVRRRLSLTQKARGKPIPTGVAPVQGTVLGIFAARKFAVGNFAARIFAVGKLAARNFRRTRPEQTPFMGIWLTISTWYKPQLARLTE